MAEDYPRGGKELKRMNMLMWFADDVLMKVYSMRPSEEGIPGYNNVYGIKMKVVPAESFPKPQWYATAVQNINLVPVTPLPQVAARKFFVLQTTKGEPIYNSRINYVWQQQLIQANAVIMALNTELKEMMQIISDLSRNPYESQISLTQHVQQMIKKMQPPQPAYSLRAPMPSMMTRYNTGGSEEESKED